MQTAPSARSTSGASARPGSTIPAESVGKMWASRSSIIRRTRARPRTGTRAGTGCSPPIRSASGNSPAIAARTVRIRFPPAARSCCATGRSSITATRCRRTSPGRIAGSSRSSRPSMSRGRKVSRRDFLKTTATTTAGARAFAGLTFVPRPDRVFGANDRVRVAVVGLRGRGKDHIDALSRLRNVEVAALCDVDEGILNERRGQVMGTPRTVADVRRLLDDRSIDAVSIATPNHWHALMAFWACQAGKDVYVEKPCSHNLWEGRQLVRAAERYGRIVQQGSQLRSTRAAIEAIEHLHNGTFGEIYLARGLCFKRRNTIGRAAAEPVPRG